MPVELSLILRFEGVVPEGLKTFLEDEFDCVVIESSEDDVGAAYPEEEEEIS